MSDELAPVSERRVAFGESLMKIETAFAYFQKAFINVEEIDYTDAIAQYREFDDLYQLLDTEYVKVNEDMKAVFTKAKADKRDIPYSWTRFRTDVIASDRDMQIDKLIKARRDYIAEGIKEFETRVETAD
jgi:hypothetical protein